MSTLGIELSDVGVNAVLIDDSGASQTVALSGEEARAIQRARRNVIGLVMAPWLQRL